MSQVKELAKIKLSGTKRGEISVATVMDPYGVGTGEVASVGVSLDGQEIEWKVHIPMDNIESVIEALQKAKAGN